MSLNNKIKILPIIIGLLLIAYAIQGYYAEQIYIPGLFKEGRYNYGDRVLWIAFSVCFLGVAIALFALPKTTLTKQETRLTLGQLSIRTILPLIYLQIFKEIKNTDSVMSIRSILQLLFMLLFIIFLFISLNFSNRPTDKRIAQITAVLNQHEQIKANHLQTPHNHSDKLFDTRHVTSHQNIEKTNPTTHLGIDSNNTVWEIKSSTTWETIQNSHDDSARLLIGNFQVTNHADKIFIDATIKEYQDPHGHILKRIISIPGEPEINCSSTTSGDIIPNSVHIGMSGQGVTMECSNDTRMSETWQVLPYDDGNALLVQTTKSVFKNNNELDYEEINETVIQSNGEIVSDIIISRYPHLSVQYYATNLH